MAKDQEAKLQQVLNNAGVAFHDLAGRVTEKVSGLQATVNELNAKLDPANQIDLTDEIQGFQDIADGMTKLLAKAPEIQTVPADAPTPTAPTLPEIPVDISSNTVVEAAPAQPTDTGATGDLATPSGSGQPTPPPGAEIA